MAKLTTAYISLGSNLGDRDSAIQESLKMLGEVSEIELTRVSEIIETAPLGQASQPKYLNGVAEVKTTLSAEELHKKTAEIEKSLGRTREKKWDARTIDLDILLFGEEVINSSELTVPHPQMHLRSFVMRGLSELCPKLIHPIIKESMEELVSRLGGADFVVDANRAQLLSIAGIIGVGKTTLTEKLSEVLEGKTLLEAYDTNPFMPAVYAGDTEMALDSQLYFLASRVGQLNHNILKPGELAISDYIFDKELIYAKHLLDEEQLSLYRQIYQLLCAKISQPALAIYMTDTVERCLERIHSRNRPYEQKIEPQFLENLNRDYEQLFAEWKICPLIRISISKFDCTKESDVDNLASQIKSYIAV
ncbi:MAG: 2-amino-4-hydroxy-6-hydroxymethyldihydropteridine diphosphokinase [Sedimentisphaerales bacterium]|nr:2-amino-4-hydroxy-6-hydroxymethyldihydropteridine diphosphokinase [Sedimentisphaerales bacterium]